MLLAPAYVVSEYLVRRPLGAAVTYAERKGWPAAVYDFLALGQTHDVGVAPFFLVDFGFEPSVGLYGYWNDAGFKGHDVRLRGSTWGKHWLSLSATDHIHLQAGHEITFKLRLKHRPDFAFYGLGPDAPESHLSWYGGDTVETYAESYVPFRKHDLISTRVGYRGESYRPSDYDRDDRGKPDYEPSLDEAAARGWFREPFGFSSGLRAPFVGVELMLDSRDRSRSRDGVRLELLAEDDVDLKHSRPSAWLRYGATLRAFMDLRDSRRRLVLSVSSLFVDPLLGGEVPFTQLASIGGGRNMPGFRYGRLYDRSALSATLHYSWPIWLGLFGSVEGSVGNVFGAHLAGLRPSRARISTALGLETDDSEDTVFQFLVGFGTDTIGSGAGINALRLTAGIREGF